MSHLYVSCYRHMATDDFNRLIAAPMAPPLAEMRLDITHDPKLSDPFPPYTTFIFVHATDDCFLAFTDNTPNAKDPVAKHGLHRLQAGEYRPYGVQAGTKISVIGDF